VDTELSFICGRDAADRIVNWDYGRAGAFEQMLGTFGLLVAPRDGSYSPPPGFRHRIRHLPVSNAFDSVSATEVRARIARGDPWEHLVPEAIRAQAARIYATV
jgi:nicotinic acid mononucleotide adenylyltransferase